jgi:ADP-ribosyl-[dinitrogen reductase] hydrolase
MPDLEGVVSRAQGALLGQLAGDSLGSLVEFRGAQEIREQYPQGVRDLADGGTFDTIAGQPTDDSELALALARTLAREQAYPEREVAAAYARWYLSAPFDIGQATRAALSGAANALTRAEDPAAAARRAADTQTQANGALMRVSPMGIFGWRHPASAVASWARADALLTHPHQVTQDANALFAVTIAHAVAGGPSPGDLYGFALSWADEEHLHPDIRERLERAASTPPPDYLRQQGWVLTAFQNAFFRLLHAPSLELGIIDTVMCGGDTDTNACIAGSLLGACYGREAVPRRWQEKIFQCRPEKGRPGVRRPRPQEYWPADVLQLAERLVMSGPNAE